MFTGVEIHIMMAEPTEIPYSQIDYADILWTDLTFHCFLISMFPSLDQLLSVLAPNEASAAEQLIEPGLEFRITKQPANQNVWLADPTFLKASILALSQTSDSPSPSWILPCMQALFSSQNVFLQQCGCSAHFSKY